MLRKYRTSENRRWRLLCLEAEMLPVADSAEWAGSPEWAAWVAPAAVEWAWVVLAAELDLAVLLPESVVLLQESLAAAARKASLPISERRR
jgi:hypothetical protein